MSRYPDYLFWDEVLPPARDYNMGDHHDLFISLPDETIARLEDIAGVQGYGNEGETVERIVSAFFRAIDGMIAERAREEAGTEGR